MITEHFGRRTLAAMEVALERACKRWPDGGTHKLRKQVAQNIIRCAEAGNTSLDALSEAGERIVASSRGNKIRADVRAKSQSVAR